MSTACPDVFQTWATALFVTQVSAQRGGMCWALQCHAGATVQLCVTSKLVWSLLRCWCWCVFRYPQVGVFVSIVSTKIPFKGAGKEYIGDDVEEMVGAVKGAIQASGCGPGVPQNLCV